MIIDGFLLEYTRLISYVAIILFSIAGMMLNKRSRILLVGNIVVATGLLSIFVFRVRVPELDQNVYLNSVLTPAVFVWAITHVVNVFRE